ncbi:MAG: hypothetical protein MI924_21390 [Chloroflexales bacterium]|nr:hypothetical protein [Chloroflexales bacterium]
MTNPFDITYLTTASPTFGLYAWAFFAFQVIGVGAGLYFAFGRARGEANRIRKNMFSQLGIALLVMGGIGVFLAVLRLANVAVFSQRYWFYLQLLVELGLAIYLVYYIRAVYPRLLERSQAGRARGNARRETARSFAGQTIKNGSSETVESQSVATTGTGRREARRERKRKSR